MASISPTTKTLIALADFDLFTCLPAVREGKERPLLRWINDTDGSSCLTPIFDSWLTPCDRIGLLFGSREISLAKICEIAQAAFLSSHRVPLTVSRQLSIRRAVVWLNRKIDDYNVARGSATLPRLAIPEDLFFVDEQEVRVTVPRCGIANTGNKCYLISTLIALCGSEELKRSLAVVVNPSDITIRLQLAFRHLESTHDSYLSLCQEPLSSLVSDLGKVFEPLRGGIASFPCARQQDAHEVLLPLLEAGLMKTDLVHFREIVARRRLAVRPEPQKGASGLPLPGEEERQILPDDLYIPSIDGRALLRRDAPVSTSNVLPVTIPKLLQRVFPLQMVFTGVPGVEDVEVQAILGSDENRGKVSQEVVHRLQQQGATRGGMLEPVPVTRCLALCDEPPPVLVLQLIRFKTQPVLNTAGAVISYRREKIKTYVQVPFTLPVPVIGRADQQYELRSVIVHLGEAIESGHYVTCIPDRLSPRDHEGLPTLWNYFSDSLHMKNRNWESLSETVSKNAYLIFYDRVR